MSRKMKDRRRNRASERKAAQESSVGSGDISLNRAEPIPFAPHTSTNHNTVAGIERDTGDETGIYASAVGQEKPFRLAVVGSLLFYGAVLLIAFGLAGCANRLPLPTEAQTANEAADIMYAWSSSLSAGVSAWHDICISSDRTEERCDAEAQKGVDVARDLIEAADSVDTLEDIDGDLLSRARLLRRAVSPWIPAGADLSYLDEVEE